MGVYPMSRDGNDKHAMAEPTRRAEPLADKLPLRAAAERCIRFADRVDYSIRRMVIPADDGMDRAVARGRSARAVGRPTPRRTARSRGALSELQAAIARALRAEYEPAEPLPDRLADLLRRLELRDGDSGFRKMAAGRA
jgi:hypothetical protein